MICLVKHKYTRRIDKSIVTSRGWHHHTEDTIGKAMFRNLRRIQANERRKRFCLLDLKMKKTLIFDEKSSEARRFLVSCCHDWPRKVSLSPYIVICALIYLTCVSPDCSHSCFDCHEWQTSMLNFELINQPNPNRTNMASP